MKATFCMSSVWINSSLCVYFSFTSSSLEMNFFIVRDESFKMSFKLTILHTFVDMEEMKQTREKKKNSSWGNKKIFFETSDCDKSQIKNMYVKLQRKIQLHWSPIINFTWSNNQQKRMKNGIKYLQWAFIESSKSFLKGLRPRFQIFRRQNFQIFFKSYDRHFHLSFR